MLNEGVKVNVFINIPLLGNELMREGPLIV